MCEVDSHGLYIDHCYFVMTMWQGTLLPRRSWRVLKKIIYCLFQIGKQSREETREPEKITVLAIA